MAQTVVIDIEAQYRDKTSEGVKGSADDMDRLRKKMEDTESAGKKANASLEKIASTAAQIAKKTITIPVKILDYATKPLRSLLNYATSLKGILTGIVMGKAGQLLVSNPLSLADQYTNAFIGFETLFNSTERAQQMMNDLDEFARTTPYKTSNVIGQTQKMLAMGWDAERLIQDMTTIGDAAAATGKGDEGLERIVLALAQIKSKGKLSTEELNQLAEAGINAKAYVAAGLGYGSGDEAQQMLAKDLEGGKIGGNAAVEMILAGMKENYSGMMESIAQETVEGIKSNIEDTFEINIFRKWGQGLQEGAKRGLGAMADMLDANQDRLSNLGDKLQDVAATLSNDVADAAEDAIGKAMDIMESDAFDNATVVGKAKMLWDKIIAEPFEAWWESDGQAFLGNVSGKIGEGLGKFYGGAITTILGIDADGAAEGGINIGAKFAEGFLEGFNAEKVWEAIKNAFSNALKIIPGGEEATTGSWVSAALLGYGGVKVAGAVKPIVSGAGGLAGSLGGAAIGSTRAAELAIMMGAGNLAGNASLGVGALSALGIGAAAGGAVGGVGIISGMADLTKALKDSNSSKEKSVAGWSAASKFGMVGSGAAIGAGLGSIIPGIGTVAGGLLGAGIGGLGALFAGSKVGESISDLLDGTGKIKSASKALQETNAALEEVSEKSAALNTLKARYEELNDKMDSGTLKGEALEQAQSDLTETIQALADLYPDLITQYDIENGKLAEKLDLITKISDADREQARREAQQAVLEANEQLPDLENKITSTREKQDSALADYDALYKEIEALQAIQSAYTDLNAIMELYGKNSDQWAGKMSDIDAALAAYNETYGTNLRGSANVNVRLKYKIDDSGSLLEKAQAEGAQLEELMATYEEFYQNKLQLALNPEGLDDAGGLSAITEKIQELTAIQEERLALEQELASMEKGSDEYDATAKKIEEAKTKQDQLTEAISPFKEELQEVLDAVEKINEEFDLLGSKRLSLDDMGLSGVKSYITTKIVQPTSRKMSGAAEYAWAGGTPSAPPGWAVVGENGPELVKFRGGERVYNADASRRIAEGTSRSQDRGASGSASPIQVSLGGMNVQITSSGSSADIMDQLRNRLPEIGNELCAMIATQLARSYANMPTNAVEGI